MDRRTQRVHRYLEHRGSQPSNPDLMQMLQTQAEHIYQQSTQIEALRQRVTELESAASQTATCLCTDGLMREAAERLIQAALVLLTPETTLQPGATESMDSGSKPGEVCGHRYEDLHHWEECYFPKGHTGYHSYYRQEASK